MGPPFRRRCRWESSVSPVSPTKNHWVATLRRELPWPRNIPIHKVTCKEQTPLPQSVRTDTSGEDQSDTSLLTRISAHAKTLVRRRECFIVENKWHQGQE